jgi:TolB protein
MARRITAGPQDGRDISHRIADLAYEEITGIPGIAESRILYVTDFLNINGERRYRLMLADQDGAREQLVIESADPIMSPAWSPNGEDIAYVSFETGRAAIFMQNLSTGEREQLTNFTGINGAPAFSPDGTKLALTLSKDGNPEIYVLNLATRDFSRITDHFSIDTEPNWTADGQGLVFTSDRGGPPQIYEIDLQSGRIARLTFRGDYNARPRLSADGRFLVMVHRNDGIYHIAVQDLTDDTLIIVTQTQLDESPTISPNGALVMYATKLNGNSILAAVSLDAGVKYNLPATTSSDVREPAWSPN